MKFCSRGNLHILSGIVPDNLLCATFSCSNLFIPSMDSGNSPTSLLELTSNTVTLSKYPISGGKQPVRPLFVMIISFRVSFILDKLDGRQPLRSLFANTITEAGMLPKFSGKENWNLLLLMNRASILRSKRREGTLPWNLLYLMSKYFSAGRQRTTSGNGPEKSLLLISSSKRRLR